MTQKKKSPLKVFIILLVFLIVCSLLYWLLIRKFFAKSCLKHTISAMTTGDYTEDFYYANSNGTFQKYLDTNELGYLVLMNSKMKIKSYDFSWKSVEAKVNISVQYPDIYDMFNKMYSSSEEIYTSEDINKSLVKAIADGDFNYKSETIEVSIIQYGTKWYLIENEDLLNIYTGGLYSPYKELIKEQIS